MFPIFTVRPSCLKRPGSRKTPPTSVEWSLNFITYTRVKRHETTDFSHEEFQICAYSGVPIFFAPTRPQLEGHATEVGGVVEVVGTCRLKLKGHATEVDVSQSLFVTPDEIELA